MELLTHAGRDRSRLLAVAESGEQYTWGDLEAAAETVYAAVGSRRLLFLLCENTPETLLNYLACLRCGAVPLLLDAHVPPELLSRLMERYHPSFLCVPRDWAGRSRPIPGEARREMELNGCRLIATGLAPEPILHPSLALLLSTSGSTGSPKLVRLSAKNLSANAGSIASYLRLTAEERPVANLPMSYSYGMSVINSHIWAGAPVVLTGRSVLEREFWSLLRREGVTSLAGVPYTYQMLRRLGLMEMDLPRLGYLTQAGGRIPPELQREFAAWAERTGRQFYVMYGQTEAGPRMGYLPAERAAEKCGSIGLAIPGGRFTLEDEDRRQIDAPDRVGELVYAGDNVALGYAETAEDLDRGDEWGGVLRTGDLAHRDTDGYYYIAGRKKRFVKLYGNRVGLDELEGLLAHGFPGIAFACAGGDDALRIFAESGDETLPRRAAEYLAESTRISAAAFQVCLMARLPRSPSGKLLYAAL